MKRHNRIPVHIVAFGLVVTWSSTHGMIPRVINQQGVLLRSNGAVIDDATTMTFKIYDLPTSGVELWSESHPGVPVAQGRFSVVLGSSVPLPDINFSKGLYYLSIQVGNESAMVPRQVLVPSVEAYQSEEARSVRIEGSTEVVVVGNAAGRVPLNNGQLNANLNAAMVAGKDVGNGAGQIPLSNGQQNVNLNASMVAGRNVGNSPGQIPLSNGSANQTLNADLLDGRDSSEFASAGALSPPSHPEYPVLSVIDDNSVIVRQPNENLIARIAAQSNGGGVLTIHQGNSPDGEGAISLIVDGTSGLGAMLSDSIQGNVIRTSDPQSGKPNIVLDGYGEKVVLKDDDGTGEKETIVMRTESGSITAHLLELRNPASAQPHVTMNGDNGLVQLFGGAPSTLMSLERINIGTAMKFRTTPSGGYIDVYGEANIGYTYGPDGPIEVSDVRLKRNIENIDDPLEKINAIDGVYFRWKNGNTAKQIGVVAQNVEAVFPEIVETNADGYKAVHYDHLIAPLIEAVKELKNVLQQQQDEIRSLKVAMEIMEKNQ